MTFKDVLIKELEKQENYEKANKLKNIQAKERKAKTNWHQVGIMQQPIFTKSSLYLPYSKRGNY